MADKVVIVESGAKARTIKGYLGAGFEVKASRGHVRDLPSDKFGVDVENGFEPTYQTLPGSRKIVSQLRKAAKAAEKVYLAPDPDREGEAIAWHLQHVLDVPEEKVVRVTFNEITRSAIRQAFDRPRKIDTNLVNAQQARRLLDRIVGYELSPLISKRILRGLSAGRVQTVALRLVVEREREREAFEPEEYWEVKASLSRVDGEVVFEAELKRVGEEKLRIATQEEATALVERLRGADYTVASVQKRSTSSKPAPPFITSTMQQAASSQLRMTAAQTMRLAQQLYEGIDIGEETVGLITYMRTDSTRVADQALATCRNLVKDEFGDEYLPGKPNTFKSPKGAQAAHEAIRPTEVSRRPEDVKAYLSDRQFKLYELIWRRFVASQMTPARYELTDVEIQAGDATFLARGRRVMFDGYTRVMGRPAPEDDQSLPLLEEGEPLQLHELLPSQHFTQPPPRFTEATLVRELEKQGIGRPSTYAPTISTLLSRNYVRRERRALRPSDLGMVVAETLVKHFPREMDVAFTSHMEEELDEIEEGKRDWRSALEEFYSQFKRDLEKAKEQMHVDTAAMMPEEVACPECGKPMVLKFSRRGDKFLGCSGFPECKQTMSLTSPGEAEAAETEFTCDKCGAPMIRRTGRRGREYLACSAYPKCRNIMGLDREGKPVKLAPRVTTGFGCPKCGEPMHLEGEGEAEEMKCSRCRTRVPLLTVEEALEATEFDADQTGITCDECDAPMVVKRGRRGFFLGCTRYPECKGTAPLPRDMLPAPQPTHERCNECGRPMTLRWGPFGRFLGCTGFPRCRNTWQIGTMRKKCPVEGCTGRLVKKTDSEGVIYLGCSRYPECQHTEPAPKSKKKAESADKA